MIVSLSLVNPATSPAVELVDVKDHLRIPRDQNDDDAYIESVAISPDFANDRTLIVSARGRGHFRSTDGGASFTEIASGLTRDQHLLANYVGVVPKFPSIVFSPTYALDRTL